MRYLLVLLFVMFLCVQQGKSWGKRGHQIVAEIAKSQLDKSITDLVDYYLKGMSWADAATWLDDAAVNNKKMDNTKNWHFLYVSKDKTYVKTKDPNIINQLEFALRVLDNKSIYPLDMIHDAIKHIFHLVGDIHQPLNCGYPEDKGGKLQKVKFMGKDSDLSQVWDNEIIAQMNNDIWDCSKIVLGYKQKERNEIQKLDVTAWYEDTRLVLPKVYEFQNETIDKEYIDKHKLTVDIQLAKAGLRLAAILKKYFN